MIVHQPQSIDSHRSASGPDIYLALALLLSLLAALPLLLGPGIVNTRAGGDSLFLLQRVEQISRNLRQGVFPARWMPDAAYGLGYPALNFYAALPYYIASLLDLAGCGVLWGIKITQTLGFILAGLMSYLLARKVGASRPGALLAATVYTYTPFHLINIYVRGDSLSEFYAMALYPLIIWALLMLCERPSLERIALLAGSYAALILSHNISAMLFSPLLVLWLLVAVFGQGRHSTRRTLIAGTAALALGLTLSAWFWVPALGERSLVQLDNQTTGYFHYAGHFLSDNLIQWQPLHDYTIDGQRAPFSMGLLQTFLTVTGLGILVRRMIKRQHVAPSHLAAILALLGYTWLMTPLSRWFWAHLPLLAYAQFPWRLLSVQALAISLVVTPIPDMIKRRGAIALALSLCALMLAAGLAGIHPDRLPLTEGDITSQRMMLYETYSGNIGGTVRHEYLPKEMVPRPYTSAVQLNAGEKPAPLALEGRLLGARLIDRTVERETWEITVAEPTLLAFHTTYYPGWETVSTRSQMSVRHPRATTDGETQDIEPLQGLGLIGLRLPPGAHRVVLHFGHTPIQRHATWASFMGLLACLALALYPCRSGREYRHFADICDLRSRRYRRRTLAIASLLAIIAIWLAITPAPPRSAPMAGPLVMDYGRAPYLHAEPEGIWYGDHHLREYTLSATTVQPGDVLHVTMDWSETPTLQGAEAAGQGAAIFSLKLIGATAHMFTLSPVWARVSAPLEAPRTELILEIPADIPPGLYVLLPRVVEDGEKLAVRTTSGRGMDKLVLAPIQVIGERRATGQEPVLGSYGPENSPPVLSLVGATTRKEGEKRLEIALTWRVERQPPLNYMLSLRLIAPDGRQIESREVTPLLGGYPTSLWRPGELVTDHVLLPLPKDAPLTDAHTIEVILYDRITLKAIGTVTLKGIAPS